MYYQARMYVDAGDDSQDGFLIGKSTGMSQFDITKLIRDVLDTRDAAFGLFLNINKAFMNGEASMLSCHGRSTELDEIRSDKPKSTSNYPIK